MEEWGWFQRLRYGALQAVGLGFVAGAIESVGLAASLKLPLSLVDFVLMGAVAVGVMGILGGLLGLIAGPAGLGDPRPGETTAAPVARQLALTGALLCGWYLWQGAAVMWIAGQPAGALAMAVMPVGFGGVIFYNARFWLRKTELGKGPPIGWLPVSAAAALAVVVCAAGYYAMRDTGGGYALEGDPNVVLVTVDRLRAEDAAVLPSLERVRKGGIDLVNAATSSTESGPANATALTGLHPLRHKLILDGDVLSAGFRTLPEALGMEGYATGGFVSRSTVGSAAGLDQGFRVFDDDLTPMVAGAARVNLVFRAGWLLRLALGTSPRERAPASTVDRFETWYARHSVLPHFAWVHLVVPMRGDEPDLAAVDSAIARVLDAVDDAGRAEDTLVVVAGAYGRPAGRRFLTDAEVRIPLVVRAPGFRIDVPEVPQQVRLMDVAATVMDFVKLDTLGETEGATLIGYGQGLRKAPMTATLVGRDEEGRPILGMRSGGLKWVRDADDGDHLFKLDDDPTEERDLVEEQPKTVKQARTAMSPEIVRFRQLIELR